MNTTARPTPALTIGTRVLISDRKHPWHGEVGQISEEPHGMRFAGIDSPDLWVVVALDCGESCGARVQDVRPIEGRRRR